MAASQKVADILKWIELGTQAAETIASLVHSQKQQAIEAGASEAEVTEAVARGRAAKEKLAMVSQRILDRLDGGG